MDLAFQDPPADLPSDSTEHRYCDHTRQQTLLKDFELRHHFNFSSYLQKSLLPENFSLESAFSLQRWVALNRESEPAKCREGVDRHEDR